MQKPFLPKLPKINLPVTTKALPEENGVYLFWNITSTPLYIGKAKNLKNRLAYYFSGRAFGKTKKMLEQAKFLSYIKVSSEIEALLLEAKLIRKYMPEYNTQSKDDKHPLYIKITNDYYPQVITVRKADIGTEKYYFGPFPQSTNVKFVLNYLRKIFPFAQHKLGKRACLYSQIGLCNPCPNIIDKIKKPKIKTLYTHQYQQNIKQVRNILNGNFRSVRKHLIAQMDKFSKAQKFEDANTIKDKITKLDYITQPVNPVDKFVENPQLLEDIRARELNDLKNILKPYFSTLNLTRIECFDIAHLGGEASTASMVTFINASADKKLYRHFKIYSAKAADDVAALKEVAIRRVAHLDDWGKPTLIIVDGGRSQAKVFDEQFLPYSIPVIGLAKRFEDIIIPQQIHGKYIFSTIKTKPSPSLNLVKRIRDEAHRFARRYHHHLLATRFLDKTRK